MTDKLMRWGEGHSRQPLLAILSVLTSLFFVVPEAFADSSLDSVKVYSMNITYVTDKQLPKYVRIVVELYSDAQTDLSGSWNTKYDQGWLDLKPNGLATITTYLYGEGLADTVAKTLNLNWTNLDKDRSGVICLPFDWSSAVRQTKIRLPFEWQSVDHGTKSFSDEWSCREMQASPTTGRPYTTILIPIPCKVLVFGLNDKYEPTDTLFKKELFRGEAKIEWTANKPRSGRYMFLMEVNGAKLPGQQLVWPKKEKGSKGAKGEYYYGE